MDIPHNLGRSRCESSRLVREASCFALLTRLHEIESHGPARSNEGGESSLSDVRRRSRARPERWSGAVRNREPVNTVYLNREPKVIAPGGSTTHFPKGIN